MNIVAIIPARSGSKSIPDKNIKLLGDKPLLAWTIETAFKAGIPRVIVSTDSQEYADVAKQYGAEVLLRPSNLAQDDSSLYEVLRSEVFKIEPLPDLVLLLQPTVPFRKKLHIKIAIQSLISNIDRFSSVISVERVPEKYNPYAMILTDEKRMLFRKLIGWKEKIKGWFTGKKYIGPNLSGYPISQRMTQRQDLPQAWLPTGSIYLFKANVLRTKGNMYGDNVMLLETESEININTPEEWVEAENELSKKVVL